jgi:hypothetical protein
MDGYEHRMKPINTFFGKNAESVNVKEGGTRGFKQRRQREKLRREIIFVSFSKFCLGD